MKQQQIDTDSVRRQYDLRAFAERYTVLRKQSATTSAGPCPFCGGTDGSREQLEALEARLKRLEAAQQRIDSDYYIEERIDITRHRALSDDILRQVKECEQQRTQLQRTLSEQYSHDQFAESLIDTAEHGLARLEGPVREANAWLRQTLRIYVQDCMVTEIRYLPPNFML